MVKYEEFLKATAERVLVQRFDGMEKRHGASAKFQTIIDDVLSYITTKLITTASLSEHKSIGRPAADTTAVNIVPADKFASYEAHLAWAEAQEALPKDERDNTYAALKSLIGRKLRTTIEERVKSEEEVTLRSEAIFNTIAMMLVFFDMFVEAVVAAQAVRGVNDVTVDLLAAGQMSLRNIFFDTIKFTHGAENGLAPVLPKRKAPAVPKEGGAKKMKTAKA